MADDLTPEQVLAKSMRHAMQKYRENQPKNAKFVPLLHSQLAYILAHPDLSATEKVVWTSIAMHASARNGEAPALTVAQIAEGAGVKERATQLAIKSLRAKGVLRRIRFHANRAANFYLVPPGEEPAIPDSEADD